MEIEKLRFLRDELCKLVQSYISHSAYDRAKIMIDMIAKIDLALDLSD